MINSGLSLERISISSTGAFSSSKTFLPSMTKSSISSTSKGSLSKDENINSSIESIIFSALSFAYISI